MADTFNSSRLAIMNELFAFPTIQGKRWEEVRIPEPGDLVALSCAPRTKWYLSWVVSVEGGDYPRYLLRSIDDGKSCWWHNVALFRYDPKRVSELIDLQWTDDQHKFRDRWHRVAYKWNDAYLVLPGSITFLDGRWVKLTLRERWGGLSENEWHFSQEFPDWKKTTMKTMSAFYKEGIAHRDKLRTEAPEAKIAQEGET